MATVRQFLDLSTAHVPPALLESGEWGEAAIFYATTYGGLLWVPDDVEESVRGCEDALAPEVIAIMKHARAQGCDYVLFDADGPIDDALPVFHEEGEGGPPYDAATATGMYDGW